MNNKSQFTIVPLTFSFFIVIIMLLGFFLLTRVISGSGVDQTIKSIDTSQGNIIILNVLRQEIPIEKIIEVEYLKEGDRYIDFISKFDGDEEKFKIVFDGVLNNYKPKLNEKPYIDLFLSYRFSLVSSIEYPYYEVIATQDSIYAKEDICENYLQLDKELFICLRYVLNV